MSRGTRACGYLVALVVGATACRFELQGLRIAGLDGGVPDLSLADLTALDSGVDQGPVDLSGVDLANLCAPGGPTSACNAANDALLTCTGTTVRTTPCDDGCSSTPMPHCRAVDPGGPATPADYLQPGLLDTDLSGPITFYTEGGSAGQIDGSPTSRAPMVAVDNGIGFRIGQQGGTMVAIWSFHSLTVEQNATIKVVGSLPLVLVSAGDISIDGSFDLQGECMSAMGIGGGSTGGLSQAGNGNAGGGTGAGGGGKANTGGGGGGGGGFGDLGGPGGAGEGMAGMGGGPGALFGDLTVDDPFLIGGSGGGAGGSLTGMGGSGGSGGGVLQLASNAQIKIDQYAILNAGGCHGATSSNGFGGGGGGGAGGMILIEGREIVVIDGAAIVANGGGGGGGGSGQDGEDAQANGDHAQGGDGGTPSATKGSKGGDGGATGALGGMGGAMPMPGQIFGGGGGGGVGRIAIKSRNNQINIGSNATLSPNPEIGEHSSGHAPPATLGAVHFQ